ncbi:MAG: isopentenyl-diphosphate Delta-isomerase [Candidatus Marsarchaeota archaeon]|jgi:isopentenyl-diphosphate delta-isomerase|nr:isopentenyl-diphosphate Delta-isomerase [Candidatus Marsarchaeota archaeon]
MNQYVILVDDKDRMIGKEEKLTAHSNGGIWHRAISVFVFNDKGETMLQRRALSKYHTPGKWSNTCCSHPTPGEKSVTAAHRRLYEEMGFDCPMKYALMFKYEADVGKKLTEREYDHIFFGKFEGEPKLNPDEVVDWRWISLSDLKNEITEDPEAFTPWLRLMVDTISKKYADMAKEL